MKFEFEGRLYRLGFQHVQYLLWKKLKRRGISTAYLRVFLPEFNAWATIHLTGKAECSMEDRFVKAIGREKALERLLEAIPNQGLADHVLAAYLAR